MRKAGYLPVSDDAPKNSAFGARARPAPSTPPTPPVANKRLIVRAAKADTALDWERIAREDSKPWLDKSIVSTDLRKPPNAQENKNIIRVLFGNAVRIRQAVEVLYQLPGQKPVRHLLETESIVGTLVTGYSRLEEEPVTLDINQMQWARITSETY